LGGGIIVGGDSVLTLVNMTVSDNKAEGCCGGGIENEGRLTLTHSVVSRNSVVSRISGQSFGGGIFNGDELTLIDSTISNNSAVDGGGITNWVDLTLAGCTVSDNSAVNG